MKLPGGFRQSGSHKRVVSPDVIVIGGGLVGLASAAALADRGLSVHVLAESRPGEASVAAAGLLAPSVEEISSARAFGLASRDRYPSYLDWLRERTGIRVPLNREGVLQVALTKAEVAELEDASAGSEWLDASALAQLEPALAPAIGAAFHEGDGAVDNVVLLTALTRLVMHDPRITFERSAVAGVDTKGLVVQTAGGQRRSTAAILVATGAWTSRLRGLPRSLPVEPVRGQMLSRVGMPLRHATFGAGIYLVPRESGHTLVGSTMERVGFDARTTEAGTDSLLAAAGRLCPAVADGAPHEAWAGLRPVTPDLLPIIDRDPEYPSLLYACGHSRNGILMAPLTADCVADLVTEGTTDHDLAPFSCTRFREPVSG